MKRRMRFGTWCKKDIEDTTKIIYTFKTKDNNGKEEIFHFSSDDNASSYSFLGRLYFAWIEKIERVQTETEDYWNVILYED